MATSRQQVSYDDTQTNIIKYTGNWFNAGTYNATNTHQTGTLSSTNDVNAFLTFTFPQPAFAFFYWGMRRSHGSTYQICVDCDPNNMQWQDIPYSETHNATDDGKNPPVILWSQTWSTPDVHVVIITNRPDPAFSDTSQLTIDRMVLEVAGQSAPPPAQVPPANTPSNTPANTPANPQLPSNPSATSQTSNPAATPPPFPPLPGSSSSHAVSGELVETPGTSISQPTGRGNPPIASLTSTVASSTSAATALNAVSNSTSKTVPIIGGSVGSVVFLTIIILCILCYIRVRRRQRRKQRSNDVAMVDPFSTIPSTGSTEGPSHSSPQSYYSFDPTTTFAASVPPLGAQSKSRPSEKTRQDSQEQQFGSSRAGPPASVPTSRTTTSPPASSGESVSRERDAGPLMFEFASDGGMTLLPPDYLDATRSRRNS